jgi:anti-sigma B factor antagonist
MVGGTTPRFDVETAVGADVGRVMVSGDLDVRSAPRLITVLRDVAHTMVRRIELDCRCVDFVDSAGVRALIVGRNEAMGMGVNLTVVGASSAMRRVLDITGLASILVSC